MEFDKRIDLREELKKSLLLKQEKEGGLTMQIQEHLNAVGEITELIYKATHEEEN